MMESHQRDYEVLDDGMCLVQTSILRQRHGISKDRSNASISIQQKVHSNATLDALSNRTTDALSDRSSANLIGNSNTSSIASGHLNQSAKLAKSTKTSVSMSVIVFSIISRTLLNGFFVSIAAATCARRKE